MDSVNCKNCSTIMKTIRSFDRLMEDHTCPNCKTQYCIRYARTTGGEIQQWWVEP